MYLYIIADRTTTLFPRPRLLYFFVTKPNLIVSEPIWPGLSYLNAFHLLEWRGYCVIHFRLKIILLNDQLIIFELEKEK